MTQILLCTVGGSHQPIVSAINDMRPDFVVFICTGKDPATGRTERSTTAIPPDAMPPACSISTATPNAAPRKAVTMTRLPAFTA